MPINILMPALSPTMEKGNLAKWLKKEGDKVKSGDVIAEIETDKATMEVEAVDEGTLAKIVVPEGTTDVPVNQLIAVLAGEGEDASKVTAASAAPAPKPARTRGTRIDVMMSGDARPKPDEPARTPTMHASSAAAMARAMARRLVIRRGSSLASAGLASGATLDIAFAHHADLKGPPMRSAR